MRISRPPPRFSPEGEVYVAKARLMQAIRKKFSKCIRLPEISIRRSKIPNAGHGLFLNEKVQRGQVMSLYRRKFISERQAKELKRKVMHSVFRRAY